MEFSRQKYWSGLPFPTPGDLLDSGIKPGSPAKEADSLPSEPPVESWFFLRSLNSGFHSCSPSYIATTVHKDSLFSTSSPTLLYLVFLMVAVLIGWRWYLNAVLICISQMISDVQHLFIYLWAICVFSLEKCLFGSSAILKPDSFSLSAVFLLLSCISSLHVLDITPLWDTSFKYLLSCMLLFCFDGFYYCIYILVS